MPIESSYYESASYGEYNTIYLDSASITSPAKRSLNSLSKEGFDTTADINDKIGDIVKIRADMKKDDKYDFNGNVFMVNKPKKKTMEDGMERDSRVLLLQENNVLILGSITITILLILGVIAGVSE